MKKRWKQAAGFTLVELIVVIAILGILAGVAVPAYSGYVKKANEAADNQLLMTVNTAFTSACIDKGEFDTKKLSKTPSADLKEGVITLDPYYNDDFQRYFANSGVFKYFDTLYFVATEGIFKGDTVAGFMESMVEKIKDSNFKEQALDDVTAALDLIGYYFSGNDSNFPGGFSLDDIMDKEPEDVRNAFNLGKFTLSDEEILAKYDPNCANMTLEQIKEYKENNLTTEQMNTIKGNAYVMWFAEDARAQAGNADKVLSDVNNLLSAMTTPFTPQMEQEMIAYYNSLPGVTQVDTAAEAAAGLKVDYNGMEIINGYAVYAMLDNGTTNSSGISTLGSMYALAAGFYNSEYATGLTKPENFASFDAVQKAMETGPAFQNYMTNKAKQDISAYLSTMSYLATNGVNMNGGDAFNGGGLQSIKDALNK